MEFRILGPMRVVVSGRDMTVGSGRQRAMLAVLLLAANHPVSADRLIDAVWGERPASSAPNLVRTYIWRLRILLTENGEPRLTTEPAGYRLRVEPGELDAAEFERLLGLGRTALAHADAHLASTTLGTALELWRGEPLDDVLLHNADLAAELQRLSELRVSGLEDRIEAALALGSHEDVIGELRQLATRHPLRERFAGQLMLAYYRSDRQADALEVYRRLRATLVEELGLDPSAELRALHDRILRSDPALRAGRGMRRGDKRAVPQLLPAVAGHFAGRTEQLKVLSELARHTTDGTGTVVISAIDGTAGIGKTTLAIHWAQQNRVRFPDGQLHVNLRGFAPDARPVTADEALRGFLGALEVPPARIPDTVGERSALYRSLLADKRVLVVLDNARDTDQVRPLLPGGSTCLTLVTSRNPLVGLIAAEGAYPVTLGLLTSAESHDLLAGRLGVERVLAEPAATAELIEFCARLPLALSIAAARAALSPELPLSSLVEQLQDAQSRLDALDIDDANTNVRAVFFWSYRGLSAPGAQMFRLLATHHGPDISLAAAAALAAIPLKTARRLLRELVHGQLLTEHLPGRFAFHDLLRAYAGELLHAEETDEDRDAAANRLIHWYLGAAINADVLISPQRFRVPLDVVRRRLDAPDFESLSAAVAWCDAECANLVAATRLAAATGDHVAAWQLPWAMLAFFELRRRFTDWRTIYQIGLASARCIGDSLGEAAISFGLASAHYYPRQFTEASDYLRRSRIMWRRAGEPWGEAMILNSMGNISLETRQYTEAIDLYKQALATSREIGFRRNEGVILCNLMEGYCETGRFDEALELAPTALSINHESGSSRVEAFTLCHLARAVAATRSPSAALPHFEKALAIAQATGDRHVEAWALDYLGTNALAVGRPTEATDYWQRAVELFDELQDPHTPELRTRLYEAYARINKREAKG